VVIIKGEKYMMLTNRFWQKKLVFSIIFLFLFSGFSSVVSSEDANPTYEEGMNEEDGIYYSSTFQNNVKFDGDCYVSDDTIKLRKKESSFEPYNFDSWSQSSLHRTYLGDFLWFPSFLPLSIIFHVFNNEELTMSSYYKSMAKDDGKLYPDRKIPSELQQWHHFRFKIDQEVDTDTPFKIFWHGVVGESRVVELFAWHPFTTNSNTGYWKKLIQIQVMETSI